MRVRIEVVDWRLRTYVRMPTYVRMVCQAKHRRVACFRDVGSALAFAARRGFEVVEVAR